MPKCRFPTAKNDGTSHYRFIIDVFEDAMSGHHLSRWPAPDNSRRVILFRHFSRHTFFLRARRLDFDATRSAMTYIRIFSSARAASDDDAIFVDGQKPISKAISRGQHARRQHEMTCQRLGAPPRLHLEAPRIAAFCRPAVQEARLITISRASDIIEVNTRRGNAMIMRRADTFHMPYKCKHFGRRFHRDDIRDFKT